MPTPRKSPRNRKSATAMSQEEGKENNFMAPMSGSRKRSKSLGGSGDVTLPLTRKRRGEGSSIAAPRSILKPYTANDDNHTVIGVMQVALREEPKNLPKKQSRRLSRRVSFAPEATLHTFELDREDREDTQSSSASSKSNSPYSKEYTRRHSSSNSPIDVKCKQQNSYWSSSHTTSPVRLRSESEFSGFDRSSKAIENVDGDYDDGDETDDMEMEDATDVFDDIFDPASLRPLNVSAPVDETTLGDLARVEPAARPFADISEDEQIDEATMDVTRAIGTIKTLKDQEDATMEITTAIGHIEMPAPSSFQNEYDEDEDEKTMDITRAVGIISRPDEEHSMDLTKAVGIIKSVGGEDDITLEETMDVTRAIGSISEGKEATEEITMDVTRAVGSIQSNTNVDDDTSYSVTMDITKPLGTVQMTQYCCEEDDVTTNMDITRTVGSIRVTTDAVDVKEHEMTNGIVKSPIASTPNNDLLDTSLQRNASTGRSGNKRTSGISISVNPESAENLLSPVSLSSRTMSSIDLMSKSYTPKTTLNSLDKQACAAAARNETPTRPNRVDLNRVIEHNTDGCSSLRGSPRSIESLKKRRSLVDSELPIPIFEGRRLSIGTPEGKKLKNDINKTLFDFSTSSIQKKIQSLTPKKAIRTPAKLSTSSNKKKIIESLKFDEQEALAKFYSPLKSYNANASSPTKASSKKSVRMLSDTLSPVLSRPDLAVKIPVTEVVEQDDNSHSRISLTDFMRLTSVQFLEGLNTKRRNTTFIHADANITEPTFEQVTLSKLLDCPMLELHEFSCRELRKNIEEGNQLFERLEAETVEENPLLFKQYLSSSIDRQTSFCAQFKTIKSYARLQAKGVWYEWRAKLLDGVMSTLNKNVASLNEDRKRLTETETEVKPMLSDIESQHKKIKDKLQLLRTRKQEFEGCDKEELQIARMHLSELKSNLCDDKLQSVTLDEESSQLSDAIAICIEEIKATRGSISAAEKIIAESKGLEMTEIRHMQRQIRAFEFLFGWSVRSIRNQVLELQLDGSLSVNLHFDLPDEYTCKFILEMPSPIASFLVSKLPRSASRPIVEYISQISRMWYTRMLIEREAQTLTNRHISYYRILNEKLVIFTERFTKATSKKQYFMSTLSLPDNNQVSGIPGCKFFIDTEIERNTFYEHLGS
ncbi:Spc7 kinetochore protein-domain-containing protein [Dipodascopsis uninucleata]